MGKSYQLSEIEQMKLHQWTVAHATPQQVALRCRIVLGAAAGESDVTIAKRLAVNRNTVILWRHCDSDRLGMDIETCGSAPLDSPLRSLTPATANRRLVAP